MDNTYIVTKNQMNALRRIVDTFYPKDSNTDQPRWMDLGTDVEIRNAFISDLDGSFGMNIRLRQYDWDVDVIIREGDNWMDIEGQITRKNYPSVQTILRKMYESWEVRQKQILAARKPGSSAVHQFPNLGKGLIYTY